MSHCLPVIATGHDQLHLQTGLKLALLIAAAITFQKSSAEFGLGPYFTQTLLSTGCVAIWNGVMLRKTHPRVARLVEEAGIALVFLAFNMLLASLVPKGLFVWCLPVLCFGFFVVGPLGRGGSASRSCRMNLDTA